MLEKGKKNYTKKPCFSVFLLNRLKRGSFWKLPWVPNHCLKQFCYLQFFLGEPLAAWTFFETTNGRTLLFFQWDFLEIARKNHCSSFNLNHWLELLLRQTHPPLSRLSASWFSVCFSNSFLGDESRAWESLKVLGELDLLLVVNLTASLIMKIWWFEKICVFPLGAKWPAYIREGIISQPQ